MMKVGYWYFKKSKDLFEVIQCLQLDDEVLVKKYWPSKALDQELDLKSTCSIEENIEAFTFWKEGVVGESDKSEIKSYLKIKTAKSNRKTEYSVLIAEGKEALLNRDFELAIELLTTAAPFDKLNTQQYLLRAKAYFGAQKYFEAEQDIEYFLWQNPDHIEGKGLQEKIKKYRK